LPDAAPVRRSSGILLPVASLPNGRLDREAYRFVDWLHAAGQSWWQVLPLGPPDHTGSPYSAASAFAAHAGYLADPDAQVSATDRSAYRSRNGAWIGDWERYAGGNAIDDQIRFDREWSALRTYARSRGVRVMGDLPIFVAAGSADHRAHPELFVRGVISGVPPDAFSASGQRWGNPLYDWPALRARGYRWWIDRFRRQLALFDLLRVDHFRGFVAYWAIPARASTARSGRWRRGPGKAIFRALRRELGHLPLVAEDLGVITAPVERLREELGLPGMRVLQFAFDGDPRNPHRPEQHPARAVAYTGTHDNDTTAGWWRSLGGRERERVGIAGREPHWEVLELAWGSRAQLAIAPAQDILGLGAEARLNHPGRTAGNWRWRVERGALTPALARRLREATRDARRVT
jgi:4-alpha-glucanotransferase